MLFECSIVSKISIKYQYQYQLETQKLRLTILIRTLFYYDRSKRSAQFSGKTDMLLSDKWTDSYLTRKRSKIQ